MRFLIAASIVALVVAAGAQATTPYGTLSGVVMRGPITPVCAAEQPCDEPAAKVSLLFARNGTVLGKAVTDGAGRYRLRLPAGSYTVRRAAATSGVDRRLDPNRVRLYSGRAVHIDFTIDTGIR